MSGYIFDAKSGKPLGEYDVPTPITFKADAFNMTVKEEKPSIETMREMHVEFESIAGDSSKALTVETLMTFKELRKLARDLMGGAE